MRIIISMIFLFCNLFLYAQNEGEFAKDSLREESRKNLQLYIAPTYSLNQFAGTRTSFAGMNLGLVVREKIDFYVSYSRILNNLKRQIIFPAIHKYDQTNLGFHTQYNFPGKKICLLVGLGILYGATSWKPENDSHDTFTDHIYIYEFIIGTNWRITKTFSFQGNFGYNITQDVDMVGLDTNDYNGLKADLILKIRVMIF